MWPSSGQLSLTVTLQVPIIKVSMEAPPSRGQGPPPSESWFVLRHGHTCTQVHTNACMFDIYMCTHRHTVDVYSAHMRAHAHTQPHAPPLGVAHPAVFLSHPPLPQASLSPGSLSVNLQGPSQLSCLRARKRLPGLSKPDTSFHEGDTFMMPRASLRWDK